MRAPDLTPLGQDLTPLYDLGAPLGRGGFGAVHRATERATGRAVALKLLQVEHNALAVERFIREARVVAALDHPNVVRVHGAGSWSGRPCIVYALVEGRTLDEAWRGLPPRRRAELVRDAARGVGHAHARGVVHRDLKPANLLVDGALQVKVADFGLALLEGADRLTRTGALMGTPQFIAPELLDGGSSRAGPTADVWSLGVLLYEALVGRAPFPASTLFELIAQVSNGPRPPREVAAGVDPGLEAVCLRALARDPAARQADANAFADELELALGGGQPPPVPRRRAPPRSRLPAMAGTLLAVVAAALAALALPRGPDPAPAAPSPVASAAAPAPAATGTTSNRQPAPRWVLPPGLELKVRISWSRGQPAESVFRWTYGLEVEDGDDRRVSLRVTVLETTLHVVGADGTLNQVGKTGREIEPLAWSIDPRTGRVLRVSGATPPDRQSPTEILGVVIESDEFLQMSLLRLLHLLPPPGHPDPTRWSFDFPLTSGPDSQVGVRVCEASPRAGGGLSIATRIERLPEDLVGRYALEGQAEWVDGLIVRARVHERDAVLSMGDTLYEWEILP